MSTSPGHRLRSAWQAQPLAIPGVFNALVGRMAEHLGYRAIYLSGAALSAAAGVPDVGLLTLTEFVEQARTITLTTSLPLLCDADTGFGEALNVERAVRLFEAAGVAGIHLEDQQLPKKLFQKSLCNTLQQMRASRRRWKARCIAGRRS